MREPCCVRWPSASGNDARSPGRGNAAGLGGRHRGPRRRLVDAPPAARRRAARRRGADRRGAGGGRLHRRWRRGRRRAGHWRGGIGRVGALVPTGRRHGFMHAYLEALRLHYRTLRHDLRNPLGTIRGALALMEDETVPLEARSGPRVRAMVGRNAGSLDALIGAELGDAADPSARLRATGAAAARGGAAPCAGRCARPCGWPSATSWWASRCRWPSVNGATLELALSAVVLAALRHAVPGTVLRIGDAPGDARAVALCCRSSRARPWPSPPLRPSLLGRGGVALGRVAHERRPAAVCWSPAPSPASSCRCRSPSSRRRRRRRLAGQPSI